RRTEMDILTKRLAAAVAGHGTTVVLAGASGSGRTRLTVEIAAAALQRGARVGSGSCTETELGPALAPFSGIISTLVETSDVDDLRADVGRRGDVLTEAFPGLAAKLHAVSVPERIAPKEERYR